MKLYCNTMFCIVAGKGSRRQNGIAIQNCIVTRGWALGWTWQQALGAGLAGRAAGEARQRAGRGRRRARCVRSAADEQARGARGAGVRQGVGHAGGLTGVRADAWERGSARRRIAGARGAAGWALLCAPGRASWASWVLVHLARFFDLVFDSVFS